MMLFHKYYLINKDNFTSTYEVMLSALTCFFIAIKTNYGYVNIDNFSLAVKKILDEKKIKNSKDYTKEEIGDKILSNEVRILIKIGFDLDIILPYKYLDNILSYLRTNLRENLRNFMQTTTNFINDSFKIPLCLYFDPKLIALSSIMLTSKFYNITLPDLEDGSRWYNIFDKSIKLENLIEIANILNNMYMIIAVPNNKSKDIFDKSLTNLKEVSNKKKPSNNFKK